MLALQLSIHSALTSGILVWQNRNAENSTKQPDRHQWMLEGHVPILRCISVWPSLTKAAWSESCLATSWISMMRILKSFPSGRFKCNLMITQISHLSGPWASVLENWGGALYLWNLGQVSNFSLSSNLSLYNILGKHSHDIEYVNSILPCLVALIPFSKIYIFLYNIVNINENSIWCSQMYRLCLASWMHFQNVKNRTDNG